jgi:tetratricopeptide (TPR) repeat protein
MRTARIAAFSATLALAALAGCKGHGAYTSDGLKEANNRVSGLKAGNAYQQAEQAFFAGDLEKARKAIDNSVLINPSLAKSHLLKGRIMIEQGDLEGALDTLQKAEACDSNCTEAYYYEGIVFERFAQADKALEKYQKAAELEGTNAQYAVAAAEMMVDLGNLDGAETFLTSRKATFEHNAGVRQTLGHIAMIRHKYEKACMLFNEARLLAPDDTGILEDLVQSQVATGKFAEAEFNLDKLLKVPSNKDRRDLKMMRARCLAEVDRPLEARDLLIELTGDSAGQKDAEAWVGLGHVCFVLHDMNRLRMASSRVIALAPASPEGYMLKAMWQRHMEDAAGALASLDEAVRLRGQRIDPLMLRGMILQDMGRFDDAIDSYAMVLQQDPDNADAKAAYDGVLQLRTAMGLETPGPGTATVPEEPPAGAPQDR